MKRFIVFLLLLALPIRTVLAVSGLGCAMLPMPESHAESHGAPCPTHVVQGVPVEAEAATDDAGVSCPACALACCAALAPDASQVAAVALLGGFDVAVVETSFANAVPQALERPPRLA